jgi:SAM-dependent MidA family methyltransferase
VGSLFGELLAFTFARRLESLPGNAVLIEAGAHDGRLAQDVLNWFKLHRPEIYERLRYGIVEPSAKRQAWQSTRLEGHSEKLFWTRCTNFQEDLSLFPHVPSSGQINGIVFSNELLDAFPVHRLSWSKKESRWRECCVGWVDGAFAWCVQDIENPEVRSALPSNNNSWLEHLPDRYIIEVCPAATKWWEAAARTLNEGDLMAFDYGFSEEDRFSPAREGGTLRAYQGHQCSDKILNSPGAFDLTAHVDFPEIIRAGERAGLRTDVFQTQGRFLARVATEIPPQDSFAPPWDKPRIRQFSTLTHPELLGQSFKVLVQSKGK